jgi:hypothetical protein
MGKDNPSPIFFTKWTKRPRFFGDVLSIWHLHRRHYDPRSIVHQSVRAHIATTPIHNISDAALPPPPGRHRSRRGRNRPARGCPTPEPPGPGSRVRNRLAHCRPGPGRQLPGLKSLLNRRVLRHWGCFVTKKFIRVFKMGADCPFPNLGTFCHKIYGDGLSRGWIVQGTDHPGDGSSRGRIVQGTDHPGDRSSRGRIVQGTDHPGDGSLQKSGGRIITGTDRSGTHHQGAKQLAQGP